MMFIRFLIYQKKIQKRKRICTAKDFREKVRDADLIQVNCNKNKKGIPQGSPISALLSNIYMANFDVQIKHFIDQIGGKYFRYCDDILCIVPIDCKSITELIVKKFIDELGLEINDDKTEKREFKTINNKLQSDKPLQYLGFTFDGQRKILRSAGFARYSERMKTGVALAKATQKKHNKIRSIKGLPMEPIYKRKLYCRYSHIGKRNFIRYALLSADIMKSKAIKRQVKPLWQRLQNEIKK